VRAAGAVFPSILTPDVFGVSATALVNQIVPLDELWPRADVERVHAALSSRPMADGLAALRHEVMRRFAATAPLRTVERSAARLLTVRGGRLAIDDVAASYGVSRQQFARRFQQTAGMPPKLFARIVRFQALVHALLSSDVSQWASVAPGAGFYDQAHMINEFRSLAGAAPTVFFQPHDATIDLSRVQVRGRPSEWVQ
jgi:AraC-like DNA-binding protein